MLYPPPIQCRKLLGSAIKKPFNQIDSKKMFKLHIFTEIFYSKFKIQMAENRHAKANGSEVTYSKIQIRL